MHLLGELRCAVISVAAMPKEKKELRRFGTNLDKCLKSALGNVTPRAPQLCGVQSSLCDAMAYQPGTQGRLDNNLVDDFLSYLIHSDKRLAPIGLVLTAVNENKDNKNVTFARVGGFRGVRCLDLHRCFSQESKR